MMTARTIFLEDARMRPISLLTAPHIVKPTAVNVSDELYERSTALP